MPITETHFNFPGQVSTYKGKVRDTYQINDAVLIMVATDRISAFDTVFQEPIPYKGQVLNQMASFFLEQTRHIVPNWSVAFPDPNVTVGKLCIPYPIEVVVRGYLSGHAWRLYAAGRKEICGVSLPAGLRENERLPTPIITPTTKAPLGHDQDISSAQILSQKLVPSAAYESIEAYSHALFQHGSEKATERGLILADTKYEFGQINGQIFLIDELHTPDSSRYFYLDGYDEAMRRAQPLEQLSKEFFRQWLISMGFQGREKESIPEVTSAVSEGISKKYISLFEKMTGTAFHKASVENMPARIEKNILHYLANN